jgi:ketosteroid isomerase-like protein
MRALSATRLLGVLLITSVAYAQGSQSPAKTASGTEQQLTKMLEDFLAAVPRGDRQVFDSFFADDVIYTRSAGVTVNKAEIMKNIDVRAANEPAATFAAEDISVHPYGNMAVVNFRLVMRADKDGKQETTKFRNTGTFLKRSGKWQVVAWQSTKVPEGVEKDHL